MLNWSNTTSAGAINTPTRAPFYTNGARTAFVLYCPTARNVLTNGATNLLVEEADRTSHTCYMRGLSEHLKIQTSSGVPWLWRRVTFTLKDIGGPFQITQPSDASPVTPTTVFADTSVGMVRTWIDVSINNSPNTFISQRNILFKGTEGSDWNDTMTAPIDTTRVTLKSDVTRRISSGNSNGVYREYKVWHPMNKNLVYDDDENGPTETGAYFSTSSRAGMGDYYILDIIAPGTGSTASDILQITSTSTLYWHEKA